MRSKNHILVSSNALAATALSTLMATSAYASAPYTSGSPPKFESLAKIIADKAPMKPSPIASIPCAVGSIPYEILDSQLTAVKDKNKKNVARNVDQKTIKFCVMGEYDSATLNQALGFGQKYVPYYNIISGYSFTLKRYLTKDESIDVLQHHVASAQKSKRETIAAGFAFNNKSMPRAIGEVSSLPQPSLEHLDKVSEAIRDADGTMTFARLNDIKQHLALAKPAKPLTTLASMYADIKPVTGLQLVANDLHQQVVDLHIRPSVVRWHSRFGDADATVELASETNTGIVQIHTAKPLSPEEQRMLAMHADQEFIASNDLEEKPALQHFFDPSSTYKTPEPVISYAANTRRVPSSNDQHNKQNDQRDSDARLSNAIYYHKGPPSGGSPSSDGFGEGGGTGFLPTILASMDDDGTALGSDARIRKISNGQNDNSKWFDDLVSSTGRSIHNGTTAFVSATNNYAQKTTAFLLALAPLGAMNTITTAYALAPRRRRHALPFTNGIDSDKTYRLNRKSRINKLLEIGYEPLPARADDALQPPDDGSSLNNNFLVRQTGMEPEFTGKGSIGSNSPWVIEDISNNNFGAKAQIIAQHIGSHIKNNWGSMLVSGSAGSLTSIGMKAIGIKAAFALAALCVSAPTGAIAIPVIVTTGVMAGFSASIVSKFIFNGVKELQKARGQKSWKNWLTVSSAQAFTWKNFGLSAGFGAFGACIGLAAHSQQIIEGIKHAQQAAKDMATAIHAPAAQITAQTHPFTPQVTASTAPQPTDLQGMLQSSDLGTENAKLVRRALSAMSHHHSISAMARVRDIVGQLSKTNIHEAANLNQAALDYANNNNVNSNPVFNVLRSNQSYLNAKLAM